MDVTETERLWIFGLLLQDGGEERGFIKDDIPEEAVSMEWMEEQEEEENMKRTVGGPRKHIQKLGYW